MIKYRIPYFDLQNNAWRVELSKLSYLGDIITLNTAQGQGCTLIHTGSDDPFEPIISRSAKFTIVKHDLGLIDVKELKNASDKEWSVNVYKNDVLEFAGYLIPDGIQEFYQSLPYDVELTATDGLKMLTGVSYITNNWPLPTGIVQRSFISHVRDILFNQNQLNKPLPIRWVGFLKQKQTFGDKDAFTEVTYSTRGEGYTDYNGNKYSSYFILENYLRALQARIYQSGGKWIIERIPDVRTGTYNWSEIDATYSSTTPPVLTTGTETKLKDIGTDYLVDDGAYTINIPGLKTVTATYEAAKSENVLPNGGFDNSLFANFQWRASNSDLQIDQVASINGRAGGSAQLTFPAGSSGSNRTENMALRNFVGYGETPLPIDTSTMYKRMSLGFTLLPQNGFPFNADGIIQWADTRPFKFRIELTAVGTTNRIYVLNENGFWIPKPSGASFNQYAQSRYNLTGGDGIGIRTGYDGNVIVGDYIEYTPGLNKTPIRVTVPQQFSNNIQGFLNYAGQYLVDNAPANGVVGHVYQYAVFPETITPGHPNGYVLILEIYTSSIPTATFTVTKGDSNLDRDGAISLIPEPSKIGDVIQINFDKFQGVKFPDFSDDSGHQYAALNWFFYVKQGQRYTLDDVYVNLDDNSEVYEYSYPSGGFTAREDYTLKISSSMNGFYTSNIMSAYYNAPAEEMYVDSTGYVGNLTDMTARTIIKYRSKSLEVFEGTILGDNIQFGTIYTIQGFEGKKMLPLSMSYNTETCETDVSVVELNVGSDSLTRLFYGSNDKPLSNEIIN